MSRQHSITHPHLELVWSDGERGLRCAWIECGAMHVPATNQGHISQSPNQPAK